MSGERHLVDAWTERMRFMARDYERKGMSPEDAEQKAADDVRREIRNGPPIKIG